MNDPGHGGNSGGTRIVLIYGGLLLLLAMLVVAVFALSSGQAFVNQNVNHIARVDADAESAAPSEPTTAPPRYGDTAPPAMFVGGNLAPVAPEVEPPMEAESPATPPTNEGESETGGNCPIMSTQVTFMICDSPELIMLDRKLLAIEMDAVAAAAPDQADRIRFEARQWRESVRDLCDSFDCLRLTYTTRLNEMAVVAPHAAMDMTTVVVTSPSRLEEGTRHQR